MQWVGNQCTPAVSESVKLPQLNATAEELISKRQSARKIRRHLLTRLAVYGVLVDDFRLSIFRFRANLIMPVNLKRLPNGKARA